MSKIAFFEKISFFRSDAKFVFFQFCIFLEMNLKMIQSTKNEYFMKYLKNIKIYVLISYEK